MRRATIVLVVEDDAAIRNLILEALRSEGYDADGAADAPDALASIRKRRPDLIITDYHLPVTDGLEFLRTLRLEGYGDVPALVVSADSRPPDLPVTSFISKPFDLEAIIRAVRRALGSPASGDEAKQSNRLIGPAFASLLLPRPRSFAT
ncbi:MAG TPA: response regulator [Chloroflexota bacterium]|nr:response regulator [Chloroflexota bacterium]